MAQKTRRHQFHPHPCSRAAHRAKRVLPGLLCLLLSPLFATVSAALPAWELKVEEQEFWGGYNMAKYTLTNTGDVDIDFFSISIGDLNYEFDFVALNWPWAVAAHVATEATTGASLDAPADRVNGGTTVSILSWTFLDFNPGESLIFQADIDAVAGGAFADATTVLFNNGAAPNSTINVSFTSGPDSTATFEENPIGGAGAPFVIPEARTGALIGLGLLGLAVSSRRREPPAGGEQ